MFPLLIFVSLLSSATVWADPPLFSSGGFHFQIQYGPGFWTMDGAKLDQEVVKQDPGGGTAFVADLANTHTVSLSASYNIFGHVSLGADITGTGWNLFSARRGGAGFAIGKVAWHPLQLIFLNKEKRPIPLDFSTSFGLGYGIAGQLRGMDGLLFEWGTNLDWFFTRFFGLGFFSRGVFFNWEKYYLDYNNSDLPGNMVQLSAPSGGSFWTLGIALTFRAGD